MTLCENIIFQLNDHFASDIECLRLDSGYQVVRTPFLYPDGDHIELYLRSMEDGQVLASDVGQTVMKLAEYGFVLRNSQRRRAMASRIASSLRVRFDNGSLSVEVPSNGGGNRVWDLLMALQRLSDLVYTEEGIAKASAVARYPTFGDQFANYVTEKQIAHHRAVQIRLPNDYRFTSDFTLGEGAIIQLLSASSAGYARRRMNNVYVDFSEMNIAKDNRARLAVVDDSKDLWSEAFLEPLAHQATEVLYWKNKPSLEQVLSIYA